MSEDMDEEQQQAGGSEEDEWEDEDEDDQPSYEFRFECAKMLLELDDTTETAIQVGEVPTPRFTGESAAALPLNWVVFSGLSEA
jgi:hypothetical protein